MDTSRKVRDANRTGMFNRFVLLTMSIASSLGLTPVQAQEQPLFKASVTLVHLNVDVRDANNRLVGGLRAGDFDVTENGKRQRIVLLLSEEQPLDLLFLLDTSRSIRSRMRELAAASDEGLKVLRSGDRVSIMTFNTNAYVTMWPTTDLSMVQRKLKMVATYSFEGGTLIHAAIVRAAQVFRENRDEEQRRRAIIIVTDNGGTPSHQERAAINELRETDAPLNGLVASTGVSLGSFLASRGVKAFGKIDDIVSKTGGDQIKFENAKSDLPRTIERIRTEYSLYYRPNEDGDITRDNRVALSAAALKRYPDARVDVRRGYVTHGRDSRGFSVR